ncbi:MAG TPA: pitrilysin family protein [Myxococcota bacterium]|nr:pitrilysin family protein [Myxococcota bacterium]
MKLPVSEHRLENGLRLVLSPDPAIPVVAFALYYDVGSRNEERGRSGFAHLFEHMMFQGSANVGKAEHFAHIQGCGGQTNATTSEDRTNYYATLPSNQLRLGLWLEADRMRSLAVTPENFENQRQTVMEERRERVDDAPYGEAMVALCELSWGNWAYGHPVIGYWKDLEACAYEEVVAFHDRFYRPNNAVLAVAGDFEEEEALAAVADYFGDIDAGPRQPAPDMHEPRRVGHQTEVVGDELARLPLVFVNHQAPGFGSRDFFAWEVLETALLRGPSSRAYRRFVVEEQLAVQVSGGFDARRGPGLFSLTGVASSAEGLPRIRDAWLEELERVASEPLSRQEWDKVLARAKAAAVYSVEGVLGRAMQLGRSTLYLDDPQWDNRYLEELAKVEPPDVQRVARDWLQDGWVSLEVHPR